MAMLDSLSRAIVWTGRLTAQGTTSSEPPLRPVFLGLLPVSD